MINSSVKLSVYIGIVSLKINENTNHRLRLYTTVAQPHFDLTESLPSENGEDSSEAVHPYQDKRHCGPGRNSGHI